MAKKKPVDGHPVKSVSTRRGVNPRHKKGDWWPARGHEADVEHQGGFPGGRRPPLRDDLDDEEPVR